MDSEQLEASLNELEQRVERLRALYEQYFIGIEKIEPAVLRKDVDRRFWVLRREQIRNTAMRFKLNTINQRYNTYQQYWQRSIREIESGTYRRHLIRAEKRFGVEAVTIAARKRMSKAQQAEFNKKIEAEERARRVLDQMPDLDSFDMDVDVELEDFENDALSVPPNASAYQPQKRAHSLDQLDDLESLMGLDAGPTVRAASAHPPAPPAPPARPRPRPPVQPVASRDVDLDFGDIEGVFAEDGDDATAPHPAVPSLSAPRPAAPGAQRPLPLPARPAPPPLQPRPAQPRPVQPAQPRPVQPAQPRPVQPAQPRPVQPPQPRAAQPPQPRAAQPPQPRPPQPPQPRPPQPQALRQPPQPSAAPKPATTDHSGLSDARINELYREYVTAKRQCNESTSSVTEASLAKSLRGSAEQLSKKHKGRRVDYEVVIKEGRAMLKPVVKG